MRWPNRRPGPRALRLPACSAPCGGARVASPVLSPHGLAMIRSTESVWVARGYAMLICELSLDPDTQTALEGAGVEETDQLRRPADELLSALAVSGDILYRAICALNEYGIHLPESIGALGTRPPERPGSRGLTPAARRRCVPAGNRGGLRAFL